MSESFNLGPLVEALEVVPNMARKQIEAGKSAVQIIEEYLESVIKGDPVLVKQLLRIYLSTYTNEPINAGLLAPSSEGKTYATVEVANVFPKKDIISIGRMSPTALIHSTGEQVDEDGQPIKDRLEGLAYSLGVAKSENNKEEIKSIVESIVLLKETSHTQVDLRHKILLFLDNPKPETYEVLKPIMSHDKDEIVYRTTKGDGSLSVKETVIKGWPAVIICSAKNEASNEVWEEIVSREMILSPNVSISKYKAANKLTGQKFGIPSLLIDSIAQIQVTKFLVERIKHNLTELCKDGNPVINLFHERLTELFPSNEGITMRYYKRLLSFINIETMVNGRESLKMLFRTNTGEDKQFVFTGLGMIRSAIDVVGVMSRIPPEKIQFFKDIFLQCIQDESGVQITFNEDENVKLVGADVTVESDQLAEKYTKVYHKPISPKRIRESYLNHLVDMGVIEWKKDTDDYRKHLFYVSSNLTISKLHEITNKLLKDDPMYTWELLVRIMRRSPGKLVKLYNGTSVKPIDKNTFQIGLFAS